ncbi:MAG: SMP-30/gluconolactonase/LRE family protein, partial [Paracoccaceae bacterium]
RRQPLDAAGAPEGPDALFVRTEGWPDGSVCDAEGFLWNAEWDGARLVRYAPDGRVDRTVPLPISRPTCPAFGGPGLTRLFVTTARTGLDQGTLKAEPGAGGIFAVDVDVAGVPEARFRRLDGWAG